MTMRDDIEAAVQQVEYDNGGYLPVLVEEKCTHDRYTDFHTMFERQFDRACRGCGARRIMTRDPLGFTCEVT